MGQQASKEHAPLTFGYINNSTSTVPEEISSQRDDFVLENPHLYRLQRTCGENCPSINTSSSSKHASCKCEKQRRLSLIRENLAQDLEYIDQTYYPDLVHYNSEQDPMEQELIELSQEEEQEQWSRLTIGEATTNSTATASSKRPMGLTGPSIDLSFKSLVKLSPSIGLLDYLTKLNLSDNQMIRLPKEIGYLKNLRVLNISNNMLEEIPESIGFLSKLKAFNISNNQLSSLPSSIGKLTKLVIMIANNNQLTLLPREMSRLTCLTSLNVSNNPLTILPSEIAELTSLRKFLTNDCPFIESVSYDLKHDPPSLFETCARILVRGDIPAQLPDHFKNYLSKVDTCSYCKGPFFESYISRIRFIERRARQVIALEDKLCCAHWTTEDDRVLAMFSEHAHVKSGYQDIDMNGLHETLHPGLLRHRAYSETCNNGNSQLTLRSNASDINLLKPLPALPNLQNRPRSSSTSSITRRFTHFMRSNNSSSNTSNVSSTTSILQIKNRPSHI